MKKIKSLFTVLLPFSLGVVVVFLLLRGHTNENTSSQQTLTKENQVTPTIKSDNTADLNSNKTQNQDQNPIVEPPPKPIEDPDIINPGLNVEAKTVSSEFKVFIDSSITEPYVRDLLKSQVDVRQRFAAMAPNASSTYDHLFPMSLTYVNQNGHLFAIIAVNHEFGSKNDVIQQEYPKGQMNFHISNNEILSIYSAFSMLGAPTLQKRGGESWGQQHNDGQILSEPFRNEILIWFVDRSKKIAVGVPIGIVDATNMPKITGSLWYAENGDISRMNPIRTKVDPFGTMIGNSQDGPEWEPISDFFGIPFK